MGSLLKYRHQRALNLHVKTILKYFNKTSNKIVVNIWMLKE